MPSEIIFSTQTINAMVDALQPSGLDRAVPFLSAFFGAIIGALATVWATKASIKTSTESQVKELNIDRRIAIRGAWKGFYAEIKQVENFLNGPDGLSQKEYSSFVPLQDENLKSIKRYWSIAPDAI